MNKYDIQKLREIPIESVAERLGMTVKRHRAICCFHDDHSPSLYFNVRKNTYRCWSCGAHGGVIDLTLRLLPSTGRPGGGAFLDACEWLAEGTTAVSVPHREEDRQEQKKEYTFDARRYERFFLHPWLTDKARRFLLDERRLHPAVVRFCRLTSWRDKRGTEWLQIPYYDVSGRLIGLQSRNLDYGKPTGEGESKAPRFRFLQGEHVSLYNQPVIPMLRPDEPIFLAEGPSDTWALLSSGRKAVGIPSATLLKPNDLLPLAGRECHIYPDHDSAGEALYERLLTAANDIGFCLIRHNLPEGCKDFSDYWRTEHPLSEK